MSELIVGGDGFLGQNLRKYFFSKGDTVFFTTRNKNQTAHQALFFDLLSSSLSVPAGIGRAYICAGVTKIQACEENPQLSYHINVTQTLKLITQLLQKKIHVIVFSSNAVFSGDHSFFIQDKTCPKCEYGKQKAILEQKLLFFKEKVTIIRLTKTVSIKTPLINQWIKALLQKKPVFPYCNYFFSPVHVDHLFLLLEQIRKKSLYGFFHLSGVRSISYLDFCYSLADVFKLPQYCIFSQLSLKSFSVLGNAYLDMRNQKVNLSSISHCEVINKLWVEYQANTSLEN